MKKLTLITMGLLFTSLLFAGGLNANASELKENFTDIYEAVKTRAVGEWGDDHRMVVYEINKQSDAIIEAALLLKEYPEITVSALYKWADGDISRTEDIYTFSVDWRMVVYTAKKQIEAEGSY